MNNQQEEKISFWEKSGYGLGDTASNLFWMTFIYFMSYFYTDVFGITAAVAGTMFAVTRIWDAVIDPIFGMLADRTETKYGKFRPFLIWMAIPFGVIGIITFVTPNFSIQGKIIYAYITYALMMMVYSAINIPYGSLLAVVSSNSIIRTQFSQYRFILAFTGGFIVQAATLPMVNYFGGNETSVIDAKLYNKEYVILNEKGEGTSKLALNVTGLEKKEVEKSITISVLNKNNFQERDTASKIYYLQTGFKTDTIPVSKFFSKEENYSKAFFTFLLVNERKGFQGAMTVFAVLAVIMFLVTFLLTKERVKPNIDQKTSIKHDIKDLLNNKPWVILFFLGIFTLTHVCIRNGAIMYYFKYYIGNTALASAFMLSGTVATLIAIPFTGWIAKMIGKKKAYIICMGATTVLSMVYYFLSPSNIYIIFGLQIAINFIFGPTAPLVFAMYTDSADYSEWKTGRRATGLVMSASTMAQKFGWAIGGALTGWLLSYYGFKANEVQSADSLFGIKAMMSWLPGLASAVGMILMFFYTLSEDKMVTIEKELKQRRQNQN